MRLNYEEFLEEFKVQLQKGLGADVILKMGKVRKHNIGEQECIMLARKGKSTCPNFYVQELFKKYQQGSTISSVVAEVIDNYEKHGFDINEENSDIAVINNFKKIKKKIYFRLINAEKNRELLEEVPYILFLNLAMVFYLLVSNEKEGIGSIRISNELMNRWDVSPKKLHELAITNTEKLFPKKITCLQMVLGEMLGKEKRELSESRQADIIKMSAEIGEPLVLTNKNGINGFSAILYKDCLKNLGELMEQSFYILPSSEHEALIVPANADIGNPKQLKDMVMEVNESCVEPEDYLSDEVYYYDAEREMISIAKEGGLHHV